MALRPRYRTEPLTLEEMQALVNAGFSVGYNGQHITSVGDLPTEEEMAAGDPAKMQVVAADIDAQIAALQARRDSLAARQSEPAAVDETSTSARGRRKTVDPALLPQGENSPEKLPFGSSVVGTETTTETSNASA